MISTTHMDATRVCRLVGLLSSFFIDPLKRESIIIFTNTYIHLRAAIQVRHLLCECVRRENWKFCES